MTPTGMRYALSILILVGLGVYQDAQGGRKDPAAREVSSRHPRIYVRDDAAGVGSGLKLSELRSRRDDPEYACYRRPLSSDNLSAIVERAARYLETGSRDDLERARNFLLTHTFSQREHDVGGLLAGADMATAFDWIYGGLSAPDRTAIMSNIITTADSSFEFLINGQPDINHNYTYMALRTVAVCGLVLRGEAGQFDKRAQDYLELAQLWIEGPGKVLDTWKARKGAWAEGSHYTFHETVRTLIMMLHAYRTATNTDYLVLIERKYGNFVAGIGRFLIGCTRPDWTFERIGDVLPSRALAALTVPLTVEMLASGLSDDAERARLRSFSRELQEAYGEKALYPAFDWGMRIFADPRAPTIPGYQTLPLAMRLGAGTDEHVVLRNGWGPGSTQITILAGNHYTDHQHFDKGSFLIYHGGGLAVDSGTYDEMYKPDRHWNNYATRTLAHNCMLVFDPGEPLPAGYANEGGQVLLRGLQHHGDWQTYLNHAGKEGLEAARVLAFETGGTLRYDYLRCDLTTAYGNKVRHYERDFVYLPDPDSLIVLDRVDAARPGFTKTWLLHFQDRPRVDGVESEPGINRFPGAGQVLVNRQGSLSLGARTVPYDGSLRLQMLLPERRTVTIVGGPGYEYFNPFNQTNYPPATRGRADAPREAGAWRAEIAAQDGSRDDLFLNMLQSLDGAGRKTAEGRLLMAADRNWLGVQLLTQPANTVVLFSGRSEGEPIALPLRYEIESTGSLRHLLVTLPPSRAVTLSINGEKGTKHKISSQGVLRFDDHSRGRRIIEIRQR